MIDSLSLLLSSTLLLLPMFLLDLDTTMLRLWNIVVSLCSSSFFAARNA